MTDLGDHAGREQANGYGTEQICGQLSLAPRRSANACFQPREFLYLFGKLNCAAGGNGRSLLLFGVAGIVDQQPPAQLMVMVFIGLDHISI